MPAVPNNIAWTPQQAGANDLGGLDADRRPGYRTFSDNTTAPLRAATYDPDGANAQRSVASTHADDADGGTGARRVLVTYFDADLNGPYTEEVVLDGTNGVDMFGTNIAYLEKVEVIEVGSGGQNAGDIRVYKGTGKGGGTLAQINAGDNSTFWAHHYVADGRTAYVTDVLVGSSAALSDPGRLDIACRSIDPAKPQHTIDALHFSGASRAIHFDIPYPVVGPGIIFLNATPTGASGPSPVNVNASFGYYESLQESEPPMSVYPVTPPTPANGNLERALFLWLATNGGVNDVPSTDTKVQEFLNHCAAQGINTVFVGIYAYLGAANWTQTRLERMQFFIEKCHQSGIKVFALSGDVGWGTNHKWVLTNVLLPLQRYQTLATGEQKFDGSILDVEYWTDEGTYPPATNLPGLLDLVRKFRDALDKPCGLFSAFGMMGGAGGVGVRTSISYRGKSAQDGEHMMDHADFVVIGCYYHNATGMSDRYVSWYNYASAAADAGRNVGLYCGVETLDTVADTLSWWQEGIAAMESAMASVSGTYFVVGNSVFVGHAVHDYEHHSTMPA